MADAGPVGRLGIVVHLLRQVLEAELPQLQAVDRGGGVQGQVRPLGAQLLRLRRGGDLGVGRGLGAVGEAQHAVGLLGVAAAVADQVGVPCDLALAHELDRVVEDRVRLGAQLQLVDAVLQRGVVGRGAVDVLLEQRPGRARKGRAAQGVQLLQEALDRGVDPGAVLGERRQPDDLVGGEHAVGLYGLAVEPIDRRAGGRGAADIGGRCAGDRPGAAAAAAAVTTAAAAPAEADRGAVGAAVSVADAEVVAVAGAGALAAAEGLARGVAAAAGGVLFARLPPGRKVVLVLIGLGTAAGADEGAEQGDRCVAENRLHGAHPRGCWLLHSLKLRCSATGRCRRAETDLSMGVLEARSVPLRPARYQRVLRAWVRRTGPDVWRALREPVQTGDSSPGRVCGAARQRRWSVR